VGLVAVFLTWTTALFLGGYAGSGCAEEKVRGRLAGSMRAAVTIGDLDLELVRGNVGVDDVHIVKDSRGYLRIDVDRVDVDLLPLGLALVQDGIGDVRVRGLDVEISALGALDLRGGSRAPLTFDSLVIEQAHVVVQGAHVMPGIASLELTIDHASAGATTLRTPLSWLFALRDFTAHVELPIAGSIAVRYERGMLHLSGAVFGAAPLDLPFDLPVLDPARELEQLGELGRRLIGELMAQGLKRWP
jgi:hypothetical protein